jgi:glycosyltransferase involved in cell wall biosynthesis
MRDQLTAFLHDVRTLSRATTADYDAIQVRDKVFSGIVGLRRARRLGVPFFFWMSYPMSEGFIELSRREGLSLGIMRWTFLTIKGYLGRYLLYRFLLPRCDHVFAQSENMVQMLSDKGIPTDRLDAVPMGVDMNTVDSSADIPASVAAQLADKRVIVYQGSLDRVRRIDLLFEALAIVRKSIPRACLLLVGDAATLAERNWLEARARELGVEGAVVWTGWLPTATAWALLRRAEVGVSLIPRGPLYDCSSPTKVVEYLALGLPVVANDLPDQETVLVESGGGLCIAGDIRHFAAAIVRVLTEPELAQQMRSRGPPYVVKRRSYDTLGRHVQEVYSRVMNGRAK